MPGGADSLDNVLAFPGVFRGALDAGPRRAWPAGVVGTGVDPVTSRFSGARSAN